MLTRRCWIILLTALALFACGALAEGAPGLGLSEIAPVGLDIGEVPAQAAGLAAAAVGGCRNGRKRQDRADPG